MALDPKESSALEIEWNRKNDQKLNLVINNRVYGLRLCDKQPRNTSLTRLRVTEYTFKLGYTWHPSLNSLIQ